MKISQNDQVMVLEGLTSWYRQLWTEYLIRNPKTAYNVSLPGYLTLICPLRCYRWPISQILGPKGVKISQNGQNKGIEGVIIMILSIVNRIFN